jgi:hypothetical protein
MFIARTRFVSAVAAIVILFARSRVHADYISASVPLHSQYAGPNVGTVVAEADTGWAAVNGLQPGQVRLTFTVNPVPAYTRTGPRVGLTNVGFNTDLLLTLSQIAGPPGWSASGFYGGPVSPPNFGLWQVTAPNDDSRSPSVVLLFSGLGNSATLDHFLTPVQVFVPNPEFGGQRPPIIFSGTVGYPGPGIAPVWVDSAFGTAVATAPEPSTLVMGAVGLAGIALARRWRRHHRVQGIHELCLHG